MALIPVRFDQASGAGVRHPAQPEAFLCSSGAFAAARRPLGGLRQLLRKIYRGGAEDAEAFN